MSNSLDPDQDRQSGSKPFAKVTCRRQNSSLAWKRLNVHKSGERFIYLFIYYYFFFFFGGWGEGSFGVDLFCVSSSTTILMAFEQ